LGKRKISILENAATAVAEIAFFIESEGMPDTAKKFVDEAFNFFDKLRIEFVEHRLCSYKRWRELGYQCVHYKNKYVVAF